jgi:hypothetical protein
MPHNPMKRYCSLFTSVALISLLTTSYAEANIVLKAGNTQDRTRVAIEVKPSNLDGWSYNVTSNSVEITLSGEVDSIPVNAFNAKQSAKRVQKATVEDTPSGKKLILTFNCRCAARAFAYQDKKILVDIVNIQPPAATPPTPTTTAPPPSPTPVVATPAKEPEKKVTQVQPKTKRAPLPAQRNIVAEPAPRNVVAAPAVAESTENTPTDLLDIERRILEQLERAKQQGILTASGDVVLPTPIQKEPAAKKAAPTQPSDKSEQPVDKTVIVGDDERLAAIAQLTEEENRKKLEPLKQNPVKVADIDPAKPGEIETGPLETIPPGDYPSHLGTNAPKPDRRGQSLTDTQQAQNAEPSPLCRDSKEFDMSTWGQGQSFLSGLRMSRADLVNLRDKPVPESIITIMKHYIAYNLPQEARQVAKNFNIDTPETKFLAEVADILEDKPTISETEIARAENCAQTHALWQAMALWNSNPKLALDIFRSAEESISDLTRPLRVLLLERMTQAALSTGNIPQADTYLTLANRLADKPSDLAQLLEAHIAIAEGDTETGKTILRKVRHTRGNAGAIALISLAKLEQPISPVTLDKLADTMMLYRGKTLGLKALEYRAKGLAENDQLDLALTEVAHEGVVIDAVAPQTLNIQRDLLSTILENHKSMPSPTTLDTLLSHLDLVPTDAKGDALKLGFAQYLADEELSGIANKVLDNGLIARNEEARRLKAKIALVQNKPAVALQVLGDAPDADSVDLREKAQVIKSNDLSVVPATQKPKAIQADIPKELQEELAPVPSGSALQLQDTRTLTEDTERDIELLREMLNNG